MDQSLRSIKLDGAALEDDEEDDGGVLVLGSATGGVPASWCGGVLLLDEPCWTLLVDAAGEPTVVVGANEDGGVAAGL